MGSIGLPYFETLTNLSRPTNSVSEQIGVPRPLISDKGSHFYNRTMSILLEKYGVVHRVTIAYHPQTNDHVEVFNREIKRLLQKMANPNWND
ncbi:hypothetical protein CR513_04108, partial [Mucuna pruriens]